MAPGVGAELSLTRPGLGVEDDPPVVVVVVDVLEPHAASRAALSRRAAGATKRAFKGSPSHL